jgi:hypothetical protein
VSPRTATRPPPPPHDPAERVLITRLDGWQVRDFGYDDVRLAYFATRGFSHFQLWHPAQRVSVLTPSRLTDGRYEVFPVAGWKRRAPSWSALAALLRAHHHVEPPGEASLRVLERWFQRIPDLPSGGDVA